LTGTSFALAEGEGRVSLGAFAALSLPALTLAPPLDAPFGAWRIGRDPSLALTAFPLPAVPAFAPVLADHWHILR
jgi:hypothetical protein